VKISSECGKFVLRKSGISLNRVFFISYHDYGKLQQSDAVAWKSAVKEDGRRPVLFRAHLHHMRGLNATLAWLTKEENATPSGRRGSNATSDAGTEEESHSCYFIWVVTYNEEKYVTT